ncbi:PREDICTED: hepatoma-derived growth factor-related protein 2 isoform X2 [Camelina sativa]|uniref:Hepatoma-derived growth factor-related protein 2 isoform X1 n=1 Tax=Camelina sativa TaxID=90675 RepID=A0ABM0U2C4_CAMSA|nr:PREDICTED: hepatoma-derived growth factor-related protein 2 isoform X1 [Camelina sativa]XP_010434807.1 PREDICTED: hepatoma-derived growth factor-related protein 2 isoform X2 [Camelina sativa]
MVLSRRFAQVSSDEDDDVPITRAKGRNSTSPEQILGKRKKRKTVKLYEEIEEKESERKRKRKGKKGDDYDEDMVTEEEEEETPPEAEEEEEEEEEEKPDDASPVGDSVKVTGKGKGKRTHFLQFEYDGNKYDVEDPVLLVPEDKSQKPYVAIIKDITQTKDGSMMILGQWFYRPEEAEKKGGGNWQSSDTRELFYSFHRDEVPAESVMHRCVVYFVPAHKQLPKRKNNPGFIVRKVYDTVEKKLWKLTDKDYEDSKQHEIDLLVQKTMSQLGDLPDLESEEIFVDQENMLKAKRSFRKANISPVDVRREEDASLKAETPGSGAGISSEHYAILEKFDSLTGDAHRDKCLGKLLEAVQHICYSPENKPVGDDAKMGSNGSHLEHDEKDTKPENGKDEKFLWPDAAVPPVCALENASHASLASDYQKYNQKMRTLVFNLKNTALLARRLLNGELEPAKILNMSPTELKEGLTADETTKKEPDEADRMQMTDARCSRCNQLTVGLRDIIQAGHGDRYQLECVDCGYSWYASRDEVSTLTIGIEKPAQGTEKEDTEKNLTSPRETEKPKDEALKTNDSNADNNPEASKKPE